MWPSAGSTIATLLFLSAIIRQYFPYELRRYLETNFHRLSLHFNPYIKVSIHEFTGDRLKRSEAYSAVEAYLSANSSATAARLNAEMSSRDSSSLVLTLDDHERVSDDFRGVKVWWHAAKLVTSHQPHQSPYSGAERRYYRLSFNKRHRQLITEDYLRHVVRVGFTESRDFYSRIGKAWKRGYLLYGPPGTGKSTMIAAMANLLSYDVYDLELTAVRDNTELRKLLIDTTSKSIIVIEDIDCSLDLTGQRKTKLQNGSKLGFDEIESLIEKHRSKLGGRVTLSGLLNFIDGLWSSSGGERLIVFTTNHVEKLDPALIRRGRMDKHVELSYCSFEAFRVLAWNYLRLQDHPMFSEVDRLIKEINITPADVAENLMLKSPSDDSARCLSRLIAAMEEVKEDAAAAVKPEMEAALVKENDGSGSFLGDKEHGFQMPWPDIEVDSQIIATDFTGI
ncbi:AAA-ATPase At3g28580 [Linum grandiflorum]